MNTPPKATGLAGHLDPATIARLEAMTRATPPAESPRPAPEKRKKCTPAKEQQQQTHAQHDAFKRCQAIRERTADGQPLTGDDMQLLVAALRKHPRAKQKIGPGIHAITCGTYIGGTRCFFVIRTDGTIEDFSVRKCLGQPTSTPTARALALMARFSPERIRRAFLAHRRQAGGAR